MKMLSRTDLLSLEDYSARRDDIRSQVMLHKKNRRVEIGAHVCLYFEDRTTISYQIQEMLRAERIFESNGIQEELDTYNPLIPEGSNWKATMMIQYDDAEERRIALQKLIGIEDAVWVRVGNQNRVSPIADEDLERTTENKTSAVHFLRFELTPDMVDEINKGGVVSMGVSHPEYEHQVQALAAETLASLKNDLD